MSAEMLLTAVTGPVGALVVMALAIFSLVKAQWVVPGAMFRASEERNKLLEHEAAEQNNMIFKQADQLTEQRVANARLETQVAHLSEQVQKLTNEIEGLRVQLRQQP